MNKGLILGLTAMIAISLLASCNRRHDCRCEHSGDQEAVYNREYRGYRIDEARELCKSEERASTATRTIKCSLY